MNRDSTWCKKCDSPVAKTAKTCPLCGEPVLSLAKKLAQLSKVLWTLAVISIAGTIIYFGLFDKKESGTPNNQGHHKATKTVQLEIKQKNYETEDKEK